MVTYILLSFAQQQPKGEREGEGEWGGHLILLQCPLGTCCSENQGAGPRGRAAQRLRKRFSAFLQQSSLSCGAKSVPPSQGGLETTVHLSPALPQSRATKSGLQKSRPKQRGAKVEGANGSVCGWIWDPVGSPIPGTGTPMGKPHCLSLPPSSQHSAGLALPQVAVL